MTRVRRSTFNYLVDILRDYYYIDEYIKQREEELRVPFKESDLNAEIKGTQATYDAQDTMMITIEQDRRLRGLQRNKKIIDELLDEADEDTLIIIRELYLKRRPEYTMQGLVDNNKVFVSRRQAFKLRDRFFLELASKFNLKII